MKKILSTLLVILMLSGCSASPSRSAYRQISADDAAVMMEEKTNRLILDVRTTEEFNEKHIPGAVCIPNEAIGSGEIPELPDKNQLIMVYCRSGNRSKQAAQNLADLGYTNVVEFGGIIDWKGKTVSGNSTK